MPTDHQVSATALLDDALAALEGEDLNRLPLVELADRVIAVADALYRLKVERLRGQGALAERQRLGAA